ncbi:MAG: riboflavin biosynthesis protein RibF [Phycisphaeraceae bacterium]|nr:riboflavin biosynthesis protein RibF [Phycisphaeraceae bacterium]MCB9847953.1 riboflavin biosynthesis protein RibF [Phycisphaeraceae bacterium]
MPRPTPTPTDSATATVVTIGNFDGVHLGHQALLHAARRRAGGRGRVIAASFDLHPAAILTGRSAPTPITPFEERARLLREHGADEVVPIHPTAELLAMSPEAFLRAFFREHHPDAVVEGDDFRFGANRAGDSETLRAFGDDHGVETIIVEQVEVGLSDQILVRASSTLTRWLLAMGRVADAAIVLGRPHRLAGTVVRGDRRGRQIGFPTANIETGALLPADGIYAGIATLENGERWPAAISIGSKPTFDGTNRTLEAYCCGWAGPAGDEYGWRCELDCLAWIRGQARFNSVAALVEQIERDVDHILRCLDTLSPMPASGRVQPTTDPSHQACT